MRPSKIRPSFSRPGTRFSAEQLAHHKGDISIRVTRSIVALDAQIVASSDEILRSPFADIGTLVINLSRRQKQKFSSTKTASFQALEFWMGVGDRVSVVEYG